GRFEPSRLLLMLGGAGIITLVMAVDDLKGLKPIPRLLWQIGVTLFVIVPSIIWPGDANLTPLGNDPPGTVHYDQGAGVLATSIQNPFGSPPHESIQLPLVLAVLFTAFWIVGMTNTINWIDGLDGLAGGVGLVACAVLFFVFTGAA